MTLRIRFSTRWILLAAVVLLPSGQTVFAANSALASTHNEQALIRVLESNAPPRDKAITCKRLAIYGSKKAIPALAPLLADPHLASWARIALEAIPGPEADEALRDALGKLQGNLLIGVINSIAVRHNAQATDALIAKLKDPDGAVASAAAVALGHIGGAQAAQALEATLTAKPVALRSAAAYGCVLCAEKFLATGQAGEAAQLYDAVRMAQVPRQRVLEATRGAILARGSDGLPLLLQQLRSSDKDLFGIGLRTARELPGQEVTDALEAELARASANRQVPLFLALADRNDSAVQAKVMQVADSGPRAIRLLALNRLDRFGGLECVAVLLKAAAEQDPDLARTAQNALARLEGKGIDTDLLGRLTQAQGRTRLALIKMVALRRIESALPIVVQCTRDSDPAVRRAAVDTLGLLGGKEEANDLVQRLLETHSVPERQGLQQALTSVCSRGGHACLTYVLPLTRQEDGVLRQVGLAALAAIGGAEALAPVIAALQDSDETLRDTAVSTLVNWPNAWPGDTGVAEPLLKLARSGRSITYRVQGVRGYLRYIEVSPQLNTAQRLAKIRELRPLLQRPEEKRLAIAAVSHLPSAAALSMLQAFAEDEAVGEEALLGIVQVASRGVPGISTESRRQALEMVIERSKNNTIKQRARSVLRRLR